MAFKLKFQGKSKELYGSDNTMVRKGLVTPAYLMEGPGDKTPEKKPKTQQQVDAEATQKAKNNMKLVSTETRKVEGGTEKIENFEGKGESTGFSKDPAERAKQEQWIKDNPELHAKLLAEKKAKDQKITFIPDEEPKTVETKPTQDAKVSADQIGTELYNKIYSQVRDKRVYDPELGYKRPKTKEEILAEAERGNNDLVAQYRKATKAKTDNTVVIGSTGDADRIKNVVTDQLNQKTVSNMLEGSMMIKNLIGKNK
jgi:hypothetical protein